MSNDKIIAGANAKQIEAVWRAGKWDQKLKDSVVETEASFSGPLISPDEPWHYDYTPETEPVPVAARE